MPKPKLKNWLIDIQEPNKPLLCANILARSNTDLLLCVAKLIKLRAKGTKIFVLGTLEHSEDFKMNNELPES